MDFRRLPACFFYGSLVCVTLTRFIIGLVCLLSGLSAHAQNWGHWRGPSMNGSAEDADPPVSWGEGTNVLWKAKLDGLGHSTPSVWNGRVFVTWAEPDGPELEKPFRDKADGSHNNLMITHRQKFVVAAYELDSGKALWKRVVHSALPHEGGHESGTLASASPCADEKRIVAFFGSYGLHVLDHDGNVLWQKQLGQMQSKHGHGEGASSLLHKGHVYVNWDHEGESFIACFNAADGAERWKKQRDEKTSWASPIVVSHEGRDQLIVSATTRVRAYDCENGDVIWECGGLSANVVASPVAAGGYVFVGSSYDFQSSMLIRLKGAKGDITNTDQVLWKRRRMTPYVPSPLLYKEHLYFLRHYQNVMSRLELVSGKDAGGPYRLSGLRDIYASPVGAADRLYVTDRSGLTLVFSAEPEPRLLGSNRLEDSFSASAVLVEKRMLLRGEKYLYCLESKEKHAGK